jgi:hypothetical protein
MGNYIKKNLLLVVFSIVALAGVSANASHMMLFFRTLFSGGVLLITSGQTVNITEGFEGSYRRIQIDAGGVLNINGSGVSSGVITTLISNGSFILNGTINTVNGQLTASKMIKGSVYTSSKAQSAAGANSGTPGSNGTNGGALVI